MKDTEYECMQHGWRSHYQVCPFCMILVLQDDIKKLKTNITKLEKENCELSQNVCGECSPNNYGWIFNRVEGKAVCGCILESEPFQIVLNALDRIYNIQDGSQIKNDIAIEALRKVLPLDYSNIM